MAKPEAASRWARLRRRWSRWDTVLVVVSLVLALGAGLPLPGYAIGPGPVLAVDELVVVGGARADDPAAGEVLVATVALHPLSPFWAARAWFDADIETLPEDAVVSDDQRAEDMAVSRNAAVDVALARLVGAGLLDGGELPAVEVDAEGVDGNSAGLAFALGILERLAPGSLTGEMRVGATGTIGSGGRVGPVASVAFKATAMRRAGADLFLVPPGQASQARFPAGPQLEVVEVASLDDALAALARRGGDLGPLG
ncbi:MAG TPA: hypothetical protein VNT56_06100 [Acidimicrobiales bacterium]|nr:hypothetical protein [Acidimicrobiales bacterium]